MNLYQVTFRVFVPVALNWPAGVPYDPNFWRNPSNGSNPYGSDYRVDLNRGVRRALVLAPSSSEADIRPVIQSNIFLQAGEKFAIFGIQPVHIGSEGQTVIGTGAGFVWVADFQVRLPSPAPAPGAPGVPVNVYVKPPRKALVAAASAAAVAAVLQANVTLVSGEVLSVLNVQQFVEGAESGVVWS